MPLAAERKVTLRAILETALRQFLDSTASARRRRFRLRKHPFGGKGLQPGLAEHDWRQIRERTYEGRGG